MFIFAILIFLLPFPAFAYLDLGTGSYVIQIAIAAVLGWLFTMRIYWGRVVRFIKNKFTSEQENEDID